MLDQIQIVLASDESRSAKAERIADLIRRARDYRWVGIYDVGAEETAAIAWSGPGAPKIPRFPVTKGLCGAAVASRAVVNVGDVTRDTRYLTTFGSTRSEIIIPIIDPGTGAVRGLLDVESERLNAFTGDDGNFLERCCSALVHL